MSTKALESLIVVAIHVAHQKVKDGKVHQVQQTASLVMKKVVDIKVQELYQIISCPPDYTGEHPERRHNSPGPFPTGPSSACGSSDAMGAARFF